MSDIIENDILKKYTAEPGITRVEIPEGVTEIDNFAFSDAKEITEIILPDSLTKLKPPARS
ncbi:MAG: leucine-rich repeat domain-containing protein [Oscillospiraceae bacterium]|nr:leucine-rich repeat domain-containing protein [Oscillospiraceae bacterium]